MVSLSTNILNRIFLSMFSNLNNFEPQEYIGGIANGTARYTYNFSYYGQAMEGKPSAHNILHQDVGYLTMIYTNRKGLSAVINNEPLYVPVKPNHVIATLGTASEILVNDPNKLTAPWHWVEDIKGNPKVSIILRTHGNLDFPVYCHSENGNFEIEHPTYRSYYNRHQDPQVLKIVTS